MVSINTDAKGFRRVEVLTVGSLARAEREGTQRERIRFLCRASLLIVDEIGYL